MPLEIEMKLRVPSDDVGEKIFNYDGHINVVRSTLEPTQMLSRYYDTPNGDITSRRWSLRLRKEGDRTVAALKTRVEDMESTLFCRGEWQVQADTIEEGVKLLVEDGAPAELRKIIGWKPLEEQCRVEFVRRGRVVELDGGLLVDITEDKGKLIAGSRSEPLHELEVELLFGPAEGLEPFVDHLIRTFGLERELLSKYDRALRLVRTRESRQ